MSLSFQGRKEAFQKAGELLTEVIETGSANFLSPAGKELLDEINISYIKNGWFTRENVISSFFGIAEMLRDDQLDKWLSHYDAQLFERAAPKTVAVIMAGNIPFVGFHDMMCVLLSGNSFLGKLSSNDKSLPVKFAKILCEIEPRFQSFITFSEGPVSGFDAVIATGSNNSARYFEYYFGRYPNLIRKNRNSVAILTGDETEDDLLGIADDIFMYFGMGCRNVSFLFLPERYDFHRMIMAFNKYENLKNHHKYFNNYEYHKAVLLVNGAPHLDTGFLVFKEDDSLNSPIAMLHYKKYKTLVDVENHLKTYMDQIQCIVAKNSNMLPGVDCVLPGEAQKPKPWEYADGVDTLKFLMNL